MEKQDRRRRRPEDADSKFERWILEQGGAAPVSTLLGVHYMTVSTWIRRASIPSLEAAVKIIRESKGSLTAEDILEGTRAPW